MQQKTTLHIQAAVNFAVVAIVRQVTNHNTENVQSIQK